MIEAILGVAGIVLQGAVLFVVLRKQRDKKAEWQQLGKEYARLANAYADSLGGSESEKLQHAIDAFRKADLALDGKRDFTDAQVRIFVSGGRDGTEAP
jgi:hypothetical protein